MSKHRVVKTDVVLEGLDMTTYRDSQDPYKVVGRTYRSVDEAFKTASYATAGWRPRTEWGDFKEFVGGTLAISPVLFIVGYIFVVVCRGFKLF
jgi:hypothetical protein